MNTILIMCTAMFTIFSASPAQAQAPPAEQAIGRAKALVRAGINGADRGSYNEAKAILRPLSGDPKQGALVEYYLGFIDYQMGVVVERMDKDRSVPYLDSAVEHLNAAIAKRQGFAEAFALLSSCYGIKIGFAPFQGIVLGPKSGSAMDKAK